MPPFLNDGRWDMNFTGGASDDATHNRLSTLIAEAGQRASRSRHNNDPRYLARLAEAAGFLADVQAGRVSSFWFEESLSTSDFPYLMGDILDRQLLARYQEIPAVWEAYCKRSTVRDFRQARRIAVDGLEGRYQSYPRPELVPGAEKNDLAETPYTIQVSMYEKRASLDWRMLINDDLGGFNEIPDRLARGARRTEQYAVTALYVNSTGPHSSLYTSGNANIINTTNGASATNPPLSITALQDAMTVLSKILDANSEPIARTMVTLVVPPALEVVANNLMNATMLLLGGMGQSATNPAAGGGTAFQQLQVANWMSRKLKVVVDPYIPIIATSNGNTSWFLFADPADSRPALELAFLRGYEQPGIYMKAPNTMRVGGGLDEMMGDFDTMERQYKGIVILGGARIDGKATVASNGSGS